MGEEKNIILQQAEYQQLVSNISLLITDARNHIVQEVNTTMVETYWRIGQYIVEFEQKGNLRAEYGKRIIDMLSHDLTSMYGRGFSRSNVFTFRQFYISYPKIQTLSGQLSWSHYIELLKCDDDMERNFYEKQCIMERWSCRELKRQKNSMLFHRLALSTDKDGVLKLSQKGQIVKQPEDIIKDPYVLEFVGLDSKPHYLEGDLHKALIDNMKDFLLELGRGFALICSQYHITLAGRHFYCDLVFYHAILKCYVLIDLKRGEIQHEDIGQMNLYINYFKKEVCQPDDNPPIGIVLGASKNDIIMEYAMEGISNQLFAAKYQLYMPKREELQKRLDALLDEADKRENE